MDLFTKSVVLSLLSLVLHSELKTESIDTIFMISHRTKVSVGGENDLQH